MQLAKVAWRIHRIEPIVGGITAMPHHGTRVVKLGGSLLDTPDLPARFESWLQRQPYRENLVIVGGGNFVEAMRELDRTHKLPSEFVHWQCVRMLETSFEILCRLFPQAMRIAHRDDWVAHRINSHAATGEPNASGRSENCPVSQGNRTEQMHRQPLTIVNVTAFYSQHTAHELALHLPENWSTTTDSIAALLCRLTDAAELVLLKSSNPPAGWTIERLARTGFVDEAFPDIVPSQLSLSIVNLRADEYGFPG